MKTKLFHLISFVIVIASLQSCESLDDYEMVYITRANKDWIIDTTVYKSFILADSIGNKDVYNLGANQQQGVMYVTTGGLFTKEGYQKEIVNTYYFNNKGDRFLMEINANKPPQSDILYVCFGSNNFSYDFGIKSVIGYSYRNKNTPTTKSSLNGITTQLHDSLIINGETYYDAMSFVFSKPSDTMHDSTIIEMSLAKHVGIVSCKLNNGTILERVK